MSWLYIAIFVGIGRNALTCDVLAEDHLIVYCGLCMYYISN